MSSILSFAGPRFTTKRLTLAGMLIALEVVLEKSQLVIQPFLNLALALLQLP